MNGFEFLKWVLEDTWRFWGFVIMLVVLLYGIAAIVEATQSAK